MSSRDDEVACLLVNADINNLNEFVKAFSEYLGQGALSGVALDAVWLGEQVDVVGIEIGNSILLRSAGGAGLTCMPSNWRC